MKLPRPTGGALAVGSAGAIILLLSEGKPLSMIDLGMYMAQGREMATLGGWADVDHFTHTVAGTHFLNGTWLSQLLFYRLWQLGGFAALQMLLAIAASGTVVMVALAAARVRRSAATAAAAGLLCAWLVVQNLGLRPQLFSLFLFAAYASLSLAFPPTTLTMLASALIVAAWANLHGAFAVAPVLSALVAVGLVWESIPANTPVKGWPAGAVSAVRTAIITDVPARRHLLTALLVVIAACANPYGWRVLAYVAQNSSMPAARGLDEWQRTSATSTAGIRLAVALVLVLLACLRTGRLPARRDLPAFAAFGFLALTAIRHVMWTGMVWPLALARILDPPRDDDPAVRYHPAFGVGFVLFWLLFLVKASPFVRVHGLSGDADIEARFDKKDTPVALVAWVADHAAAGNVYNTMEWGSLLAWRAPAVKLFVDLRIWIFPDPVWQEYLDISYARPGWQELLDRRNCRYAILDRRFDETLIPKMAASPLWDQVYADELGLVFRRTDLPASNAPGILP